VAAGPGDRSPDHALRPPAGGEPEPPLPPVALRGMVGRTDAGSFDNPAGMPIYDAFGLPPEVYASVFDFGCGCGRQARQLLLQTPRPRRYVGIDTNREMVAWCRANLTPVDRNFQFRHHDVYSPTYSPENSLRLAAPFPVEDRAFSLVLAHSVFTHLYQAQTDYYLHEIARILAPDGLAFTSWFFFDRRSFPFLAAGRACLFVDENAPSEAVIYDREWFIEAVRRVGLRVWRTDPPAIAGHQWTVFLTPRPPGSADAFPLGDDEAEWLCGATAKPMASPRASIETVSGGPAPADVGPAQPVWPEPPEPVGPLAELAVLRRGWGGRLWLVAKAFARWLRR
jgi:SAM-dependent methyltransferase